MLFTIVRVVLRQRFIHGRCTFKDDIGQAFPACLDHVLDTLMKLVHVQRLLKIGDTFERFAPHNSRRSGGSVDNGRSASHVLAEGVEGADTLSGQMALCSETYGSERQ